jgi:hypothetical protein
MFRFSKEDVGVRLYAPVQYSWMSEPVWDYIGSATNYRGEWTISTNRMRIGDIRTLLDEFEEWINEQSI